MPEKSKTDELMEFIRNRYGDGLLNDGETILKVGAVVGAARNEGSKRGFRKGIILGLILGSLFGFLVGIVVSIPSL